MMNPTTTTLTPAFVEQQVQAAHAEMFPSADGSFAPEMFRFVTGFFAGEYTGYQAIDARYHDFEHTLQGTLCMARILRARFRAKAEPRIDEHMFRLGITGILLHDTGYLKKRGDIEGTGAKYTSTHVDRSAGFAALVLPSLGFSSADVASVKRMIRCTGVEPLVDAIRFEGELERLTGQALATGDLLGQMAAADYVEKLPVLFSEYVEAAHFDGVSGGVVGSFRTAEELIRETPSFWSGYVLTKLEGELGGLFRFLADPFPDGPNAYVLSIEANMERILRRLEKPL